MTPTSFVRRPEVRRDGRKGPPEQHLPQVPCREHSSSRRREAPGQRCLTAEGREHPECLPKVLGMKEKN